MSADNKEELSHHFGAIYLQYFYQTHPTLIQLLLLNFQLSGAVSDPQPATMWPIFGQTAAWGF